MWPTGPVRALAGLPGAAQRQIVGTRKPVIRGMPAEGSAAASQAVRVLIAAGQRFARALPIRYILSCGV